MARLLGVPVQIMPTTYSEFCDYVTGVMTDDTLKIGEEAQQIVGALRSHWLTGAGARMALFFGAAMLPDDLRDQFGMQWNDVYERRYQWAARMSRKARAVLPEIMVTQPMAWLTYYRWTTSGKYP